MQSTSFSLGTECCALIQTPDAQLLDTSGADDVVGEGADGEAYEREKDWREDVVPAGARHFSGAEEDGCQKEFERDPGDMEHGGCDAELDLFDCDFGKASIVEFAGECANFAKVIDGPAIAKFSIDGALWSAEISGADEAVGHDQAAFGAEEAMGFADEARLVCAGAIATAFNGTDGVEGF
jgi:hypothetical protein